MPQVRDAVHIGEVPEVSPGEGKETQAGAVDGAQGEGIKGVVLGGL